MKTQSTMTLLRNDAEIPVAISGTYEPPQHGRPESIAGIEAWEDRQEWLLTEKEWSDAEEILLLAYRQ